MKQYFIKCKGLITEEWRDSMFRPPDHIGKLPCNYEFWSCKYLFWPHKMQYCNLLSLNQSPSLLWLLWASLAFLLSPARTSLPHRTIQNTQFYFPRQMLLLNRSLRKCGLASPKISSLEVQGNEGHTTQLSEMTLLLQYCTSHYLRL